MPKLVYFNVQGRGQAARYMLTHAGVEFEDHRISFEDWGAAKQNKTYGEATGLPVYIGDDGVMRNQQNAILQYLGEKHGRAPANDEEHYEMLWYYETDADNAAKKEAMPALFREEAPPEAIDLYIEGATKFIQALNTRWADGREHAAGASITCADYSLLVKWTGVWGNPNGKNPAVRERMAGVVESAVNVKRVLDNIKAPLQECINNLPVTTL